MPAPRSFRFLIAVAGLILGGCEGAPDKPAALAVKNAADSQSLPAKSELREPIAIEWDRLEIPLEPEGTFERWMVPSRVQELEGKKIRVKGFMYAGGLLQQNNIREFPLIRELGCQFGKGAPAWHVMMVELEGKLRTEYKAETITVEGIFRVKPYNGPDGKTWAVYFLEGTKVE